LFKQYKYPVFCRLFGVVHWRSWKGCHFFGPPGTDSRPHLCHILPRYLPNLVRLVPNYSCAWWQEGNARNFAAVMQKLGNWSNVMERGLFG